MIKIGKEIARFFKFQEFFKKVGFELIKTKEINICYVVKKEKKS